MRKESTENRIKEAFEEKQSQLDRYDMWKNIEGALPEQKENRKGFLWIFMLLLFVVFLLFGSWWFVHYKDANNQNVIIEHPQAQELPNPAIEKNSVQELPVEGIELTTRIERSSDNIEKSKRIAPDIYVEKTVEKTNVPHRTIATPPFTKLPSFTPERSLTKTLEPIVSTVKKQPISLLPNAIQADAVSLGNERKDKPILSTERIDVLNIESLKVALPTLTRQDSTIHLSSSFVDSYDRQSKWSVAAHTRILNPSRKLSGTNEAYIELKNEHEEVLSGYAADIMVHYELLPKLSVGTGLDVTQLNERIEWNGVTDIEQTVVMSDSASYFVYLGTSYYLPGNVIETTTTIRNLRHYNKIHSWSVPLELVYEPIDKDWFSINLRGGFKYNFIHRANGKFVNPDNQIVENNTGSLFKTSRAHSWYGGLGMEAKISRHLSVSGQLLCQSSGNMFVDDNLPRLTYANYSGGLGLKYRW